MDPKAHLLVVGPDQDGSLAEMVDLAGQSGLSERVHFIGLLGEEDLLQAYTDADLLVLLSHRENFGMVLVEGMAAGLPALVSEEVGLAKEIQESGAGAGGTATPEIVSREWSRLMNDPRAAAANGNERAQAGGRALLGRNRGGANARAVPLSD